uniref:Uncharacterized protein n=1 Tax=Lactuca sativa TaxID=4236 RepID=A0A9R1VGZ7_LACSA|nr:hypothetical protein LSAT_V11C500266970 [Lactuca sativa]
MEEYRKMLEEVDGDDSLVDQTEHLTMHLEKEAVIQEVQSISTNAQNFNAFDQELSQQMSQQFTEQTQQMFLSPNPNAQPPQFHFTFNHSQLQVPNGHDVNEEDEES